MAEETGAASAKAGEESKKETDVKESEETPAENGKSRADEWLGVVFVLLVGGFIVGTWVYNALGLGKPQLEIVTSAAPSDSSASSWRLSGYVLLDGSRRVGAEVWTVASDSRGNRHSPGIVRTDSDGHFTFPPVPRRIGATDTVEVVEARVFAKDTLGRGTGKQRTYSTVHGKDVLRLSSRGQLRWVDFSAQTMVLLWLLPALFLLTIVLALLQARPGGPLLRLQYYGSVLLAFFFTLSMLGSIGLGLRDVNISGAKAEVLTLGFASIYQGTYVATVDSDWLFSLTSPSFVASADGLVHGFGAPLWVIFISILGAAVFTVSIFVTHVKGRIDFMQADDVRDRIEQIVRHQFYILFSPLGAVVVYQLLVAGGAAGKQVTVAIAAMAAGIALNPILDRALRSVRNLVQTDSTEEKDRKAAEEEKAEAAKKLKGAGALGDPAA